MLGDSLLVVLTMTVLAGAARATIGSEKTARELPGRSKFIGPGLTRFYPGTYPLPAVNQTMKAGTSCVAIWMSRAQLAKYGIASGDEISRNIAGWALTQAQCTQANGEQ